MKNYRPADCCKNCANMDASEPPDEVFSCSIFKDPIEFDKVCDDYEDTSVGFMDAYDDINEKIRGE